MTPDLLKCKALSPDNGWVEGYYTPLKSLSNPHQIINDSGAVVAIIFETLCRPTGLLDKNGKPIWEGDIVVAEKWGGAKFIVNWIKKYVQYGLTRNGYDTFVPFTKDNVTNEPLEFRSDELEVTGSIHDVNDK